MKLSRTELARTFTRIACIALAFGLLGVLLIILGKQAKQDNSV